MYSCQDLGLIIERVSSQRFCRGGDLAGEGRNNMALGQKLTHLSPEWSSKLRQAQYLDQQGNGSSVLPGKYGRWK